MIAIKPARLRLLIIKAPESTVEGFREFTWQPTCRAVSRCNSVKSPEKVSDRSRDDDRLVRLYGARTFCYGTDMVAVQGKGWESLRSLCVLLCFASAHARQAEPQRTGRSYDTAPPSRRAAPPAPQSPSPVAFADVTAQVGVNFRHAASPTSQKYLPETMGAGVALFDFDRDGRLDI